MKLNSDLLNEVIADAKAVRETAVQTAISRLRETFEPTVRNLISQRLREEDEIEDDGMEDTAPVAPPAPESSPEDMVAPVAPAPAPEDETMEEELEFDVDDYTDDTYEDDDIFEEDYLDNGEEDEEFLAQILAELDEEVGDPENVDDPMIPEYGMSEEDEEIAEAEEEISEEDLDEMIAELEGSMEDEDEEEAPAPAMESRRRNGKQIRESWVNNWGDDEYDAQNDYARNNQLTENRKLKAQLKKANAQLREAYRAINAQKAAINEVNLLNSKLLFLTKITSKHQLTADKQIKVLEAFDRAKTVREVKLIYATISESLSKARTKTKGIMESASRPARAVKKSLNEQFAFAPRWQELAGISK